MHRALANEYFKISVQWRKTGQEYEQVIHRKRIIKDRYIQKFTSDFLNLLNRKAKNIDTILGWVWGNEYSTVLLLEL